jgi:hypothetical protein
MSALRSEATCRLGKKAATHRRTPNLLWAGPISAPKTDALQIALFGGLETPKVFASGRPLLAHVDPSTAREVDHLSEQCDNSDCWFSDERGRQRGQFN